MDPFRDRVAVITGGASGIGLALARAFAARGARLCLADIDEDALAEAERDLAAGGAQVRGVPTDVRRREDVVALADAAFAHFGEVHLVCNNAGIAVLGPVAKATSADWELTMAVNFWGVAHGVSVFLPRLVDQGRGGHILNTASMAGCVGMPGFGLYCASKFAVVGLSEALAREAAEHGIGVSVLCPMIVDTGIIRNTARLLERQATGPSGVAAPPRLVGGVVAAEDVAARVVRGIERGDFYLFTHPEQREILRRRAARQDAMFEEEVFEP